MTRTPTADYLRLLLRDSAAIEVCQMDRGLDSAWFSDLEPALEWARARHRRGNLFTTINRIQVDRLREYLDEKAQVDAKARPRTPDSVILRWTRLFFDFDPERPAKTSSTDDELAEANERAKALMQILGAHGWPAPAIGMSGNGWHLQYRTALPNNAEFAEALAVIYGELDSRLSDDVVKFDTTVRNPARLCVLYGSQKRKGEHTPERPHRSSWIQCPPDWRQVLPTQVMALAERWAASAPAAKGSTGRSSAPRLDGSGDYASLDVVGWFQAHDHYRRHTRANIHEVLCPWHSEHSTGTTGTIVYEADGGWPGFLCQHAHCADRTIRDVLALWTDADQFCTADFQPRRVA